MESVFYAKRRNDTIFFAGLATKKTRLDKRSFLASERLGYGIINYGALIIGPAQKLCRLFLLCYAKFMIIKGVQMFYFLVSILLLLNLGQ